MQTIFSTSDVPLADAFAYWRDSCDKFIRPDYFNVIDRSGFQAHLLAGSLGDLAVMEWRIAPVIARNTNGEDVLRSQSDNLFLLCPNIRLTIDLADSCHELDATNLSLFDTHSKHVTPVQPIDTLCVGIPYDALARRIRLPKGIVNRPIAAQGDAALLAGFVREIARIGPSALSPAAATLVREQMLDLAAVALGNLAGVTPRLGAATRFIALKLRVTIESKLTDPAADRQSIAAAVGVSERHANRLLALEGTSIRRLLMERRLSKCREAIENQRHRSISDIAFAYGFRDLSHLTHAFKNRYGLSPSEYRSTLGH